MVYTIQMMPGTSLVDPILFPRQGSQDSNKQDCLNKKAMFER